MGASLAVDAALSRSSGAHLSTGTLLFCALLWGSMAGAQTDLDGARIAQSAGEAARGTDALERPVNSPAARLATRVPPTITKREIDRYAQILTLSEAQLIVVRQWHQTYCEHASERLRRLWPALDQANIEATMVFTGGRPYDQLTIDRAVAFGQAERDVVDAIIECDDNLLGRMKSILAEEQMEQFGRVQLHRQRARCSWLYKDIHLARVDLSSVIERMDLPSERMVRLEQIMIAYEREATPMFVEIDEAIGPRILRTYQLQAERQAAMDANPEVLPMETLKSIEEQELKLLARDAELQVRLAELNRAYAVRLEEFMNDEDQERFMRTIRALASPLVYPDPSSPDALVEACAELRIDDEAVRQATSDLLGSFHLNYEATCDEMVRETDRWYKQIAETQMSINAQEYRSRMRDLREQRWKLSESLIQQLRALLVQDQFPDIHRLMHDHQSLIDARRSLAEDDRYPD